MKRHTFMSDGYYAINGEENFDDQDENYCGAAIDRLAEYENLEEQGRLLVLPCKVGDTVYRVWETDGREPIITSHYMTDIGMVVRWMHYFGNRVFLTYEEAEAALND